MKNSTIRIARNIFLIASCVMLTVSSCREEEIVVIDISLDRHTLNLQMGTTEKLNATVNPSSAANLPLVWSSSNTGVVKVSDGYVSAIGLGKATVIAASSTSGGVTATCEVTVSDNVAGITLDKSAMVLYEGQTEQIGYELQSQDAENKKVIWSSSADSLVEVTAGKLYAKRAPIDGKPVMITATTVDGGYSAVCSVSVKCHVSSIVLNKTELEMKEGETKKLEVTILPERATEKGYDFEVSDSTVISIDETTDFVTANTMSSKPVYITVRSRDEVSKGVYPETRCEVTVIKPVSGISITHNGNDVDHLVLNRDGDGATLIAKFVPENVTNNKVNWTSSNVNIATIDADGVIRPKTVGYTTIIATSEDRGKTASCLLRVVVPLKGVTIRDLPPEIFEGEGSKTLTIEYDPPFATVDSLGWYSSNVSSAAISSDGTVTAVQASASPVKISVTAKGFTDGGNVIEKSATECSTTVKCHPASVKLNKKSVLLKEGESVQLSADVQPARASDRKIKWNSTDSSVVVTSEGVVTANAFSTNPVHIVVTTENGLKDSCEINVVKGVTGIKIYYDKKEVNSLSVKKNDNIYFTCKLDPSDATEKEVVWSSTNEDVATVSVDGTTAVLSANRAGYTTLLASSKDGARTASCVVRVIVPLESFSLKATPDTMYEGEQSVIKVTYNPLEATDTTFVWTPSSNTTASVIDGRIVALKASSSPVIIKATTHDGKLSQECSVTVKCKVEAVQVSHKSLTLENGSTFPLSASTYPERATDKRIRWSSNNEVVAIVDSINGIVTARTCGTATIIARSEENKEIYDMSEVTVTSAGPSPVEPTSITVKPTTKTMRVGDTFTLVATVEPSDADGSVSFLTSNPSVVTVDKNSGKVTAETAGTAIITAKTVNGLTAECIVNVQAEPGEPVDVSSVSLSASSHTVESEKTIKITATVMPANATDKSLIWKSSDPKTASVDQTGTVTGHSIGREATITATSRSNSNISGQWTIKVVEPYIAVKGIEITVDPNDTRYKSGSLCLNPGEDCQLYVVFKPSNATNKAVTWTVNGGGVLLNDGKVTATKAGSSGTVVTVTSVDNPVKSSSIVVSTVARKATGVAINKSAISMTVGQSEILHSVFTPVNTTDQSGIWNSDKPDVVTVSPDGTVTALNAGQAKITFTSNDGGFNGYCHITVNSSADVDLGQIQGVGFDELN